MDYALICAVALLSSALTLFSGFGLGSILMPFFAIFFPVEVAVAATAIVHLLNNLFKLALVGRSAAWRVVAAFGLPGAALALLGAWVLTAIAKQEALYRYTLGSRTFEITPVGLVIAGLIAVFALLELAPALQTLEFDRKWLPLGGALSGFFGGLSGHQGALRAAFLSKIGLDTNAYVGTSVASAVVVDLARMVVYGLSFYSGHFARVSEGRVANLVLAGTAAAFIGAFAGSRYMGKLTMQSVRVLVGVMLLLLAVALGVGLV